jgi:hypothetical protein
MYKIERFDSVFSIDEDHVGNENKKENLINFFKVYLNLLRV